MKIDTTMMIGTTTRAAIGQNGSWRAREVPPQRERASHGQRDRQDRVAHERVADGADDRDRADRR
jgi:hypothetical protein